MVAMCSQKHSVLFFFSGIFFIIAGKYRRLGDELKTPFSKLTQRKMESNKKQRFEKGGNEKQ